MLSGCRSIKNEGGYDKVVRPVERVDSVVHEDVLIMKVGWAAEVWQCQRWPHWPRPRGLLILRVGRSRSHNLIFKLRMKDVPGQPAV